MNPREFPNCIDMEAYALLEKSDQISRDCPLKRNWERSGANGLSKVENENLTITLFCKGAGIYKGTAWRKRGPRFREGEADEMVNLSGLAPECFGCKAILKKGGLTIKSTPPKP